MSIINKTVVRSMFPKAYSEKADDGNWDVWSGPDDGKACVDTIGIGGTEKEAWDNATYWVQQKRNRRCAPR